MNLAYDNQNSTISSNQKNMLEGILLQQINRIDPITKNEVDTSFKFELIELAADGLSIQSKNFLQRNTLLKLHFHNQSTGVTCEIMGKVRWVKRVKNCFNQGIQFVNSYCV